MKRNIITFTERLYYVLYRYSNYIFESKNKDFYASFELCSKLFDNLKYST